jgi:AraC-like DNA-binding protein
MQEQFETRSLDEARAFYGARFMPIALERSGGRERFRWRASQRVLGPIAVLKSEIWGGLRANAEPVDGFYYLNRQLAGCVELRHAGRTIHLSPGSDGMITSPSLPAHLDFKHGHAAIQVAIPRQLLETEAEAFTGRPLGGPLVFHPQLGGSGDGPVVRMLDFIVAEAGRKDSVLAAPLIGERLAQALVLTLLRSQQHNHHQTLAAGDSLPPSRAVKLAQEYMAAGSDQTITSAELLAVTGVGMRALQRGFRRHHGITPSAFLRARRLDAARTRLLASPWSTVTEVALACGFAHVGRFSTYYRARFGESPSETRSRARRRGG